MKLLDVTIRTHCVGSCNHRHHWTAVVNIKKSYIFGPLGVSENLILEKVENIPATIHIYIILLNDHLTLAYRDAKYLFHIFEIDKCHWCSASNC